MRKTWAVVGVAVLLAACGDTDTTEVRTVATTTTTTATPPTTTTTAPPPPTTLQRAARAARRPRSTATANPAPVTPRGDCNAWGWVRTRAESDACWRAEFAKYGGWDVNRMLRITYCESHGDPWSGRRYVGLLQIDRAEHTRGNGPANIALGHSIWLRQGYGAWPICQHR